MTGAVLLQALYLLACRSLTRPNRELGHWSNPSVYAGIGIVLALQALFVFAPFMQAIFGSAPLGARELAWAAVAAIVILPVTWVEERWRVARAPVAARLTQTGAVVAVIASRGAARQVAVPTSAPMPAVIAIAMAPQTTTRTVARRRRRAAEARAEVAEALRARRA